MDADQKTFPLSIHTARRRRAELEIRLGLGSVILFIAMTTYAVYIRFGFLVVCSIIAVLFMAFLAWDGWSSGNEFSPSRVIRTPAGLEVIEEKNRGVGTQTHRFSWGQVDLGSPDPSNGWSTVTLQGAELDKGHPFRRNRLHRYDQLWIPPEARPFFMDPMRSRDPPPRP